MENLNLGLSLGLKVVSCGLFVSPGKGAPPDRVLDNYQLIVVQSGTLSIWEDNVRFDVPEGHSLLLYPGRRQRGAAPLAGNLSYYWIHFEVAQSRLGKRGLDVPKFAPVQRPDCIAALFHRYLDDQEEGRLDQFYSGLLLLQILCEVARRPLEIDVSKGAALAGRAESYVTHHLTDKLSTARIARSLRLNPDYLNRVFHRVHKMTMTEYIHRRKVTDAAALLRDTTDSVAEIATAFGYTTAGYFGRIFERYHGVSPGAYRRMMAREFVNARYPQA